MTDKSKFSTYDQSQTKSINWQHVFKHTWQALSKSYLPNFLVGIALSLITPLIGVFMKSPKTTIIGAAAGLTLLIWIVAFFLIKSSDSLAFITSGTNTPSVGNGNQIDMLLQKANQLSSLGKYAEARAVYDEAKKLLASTGDQMREAKSAEAKIVLGLGKVERITGNIVLARQYFEKALSILPEVASTDRASAHLELGITLSQQDYRVDARRELEISLRDFRELTDRSGEGRAALELAELHQLEGNYPKALELLNEAETAFETAKDKLALANVDRTRGGIERIRNRPRFAIQYLEKALSEYKVLKNNVGQVQALWELGEVNVQLGRFDEARTFHQEGLQIAQSIKFRLGVRNAYLALANLEAKRNRPKTAADEFRRAIDYSKSVEDKLGEAQAHLGLGSTLIQLGDSAGAQSELAHANDRALSLRDAVIQSEVHWYLALLNMQNGQTDKAIVGFRQAFALAEEARDIGLQGKALQGLGDALAKIGQTAEADKILERARLSFLQASMAENAAIAGLSLASLRLSRGQKEACSLIDDVIKELETVNRLDVLQLARQLQNNAGCK